MHTLKIIIGITIALFVISCDKGEEAPSPTTLKGKIDQYLDQNQKPEQPGLSIAVMKDEEVVYHGSKGLARLDVNQAINAETQFRLGSISKPITAIAIMQLVEEGKLTLDDKLLSFFPELPASFEEIRIKHLLSHRSGLLDYIEDNNNLQALNNLNMQDALNFISSPESGFDNLAFEPGASGRYSNTGYVLLALIIEKITNNTLPACLERDIFQPLGMNKTFVISENEHLGDQGENYALSQGRDINVLGFNSLIYGASGVVSTTQDMILFTNALLKYELVSKESLNLMTQTVGAIPGIETDYGLGWLTGTGDYWHTGFITEPKDFWHSGGFDGYQTVWLINPDLGYAVVVLSNGGNVTKEKMWDVLALVREHYKNET